MTDRTAHLAAWLTETCPHRPFTLAPASSDASFRSYWRATFADGDTAIVMDAPPAHEDCRPFVAIAQLFAEAGLHVPTVRAQQLEQGFLLLDDLGHTPYLTALTLVPECDDGLDRGALAASVTLQAASRPDCLPDYDEALLTRELQLFPDWFASRHREKAFGVKEREVWHAAKTLLLDNILAQPKVFVHRDYHSRNLMVVAPNPGVLDFQDAVYGPMTYDLVSLLKDAYMPLPEDEILDRVVRYWQLARQAGLPVPADIDTFYRDFEWMGVQRHLKVLGIFARLYHRDGKDGYLQNMPLVVEHLKRTCKRYTELLPLGRLIQKLTGDDFRYEPST